MHIDMNLTAVNHLASYSVAALAHCEVLFLCVDCVHQKQLGINLLTNMQ